jgi:hypothetical protein
MWRSVLLHEFVDRQIDNIPFDTSDAPPGSVITRKFLVA